MPYNADLATALSLAPQLGTLTATSKPTATQGTAIWNRAYDRVRVAFRTARLSDTLTSSSLAEGLAQDAEMHLTSGRAMLSKGSLGKDAKATAGDLIKEGLALLRRIETGHNWLVTEGASAEDASATRFVRSHQVDDADPDFDRTAGTGDRYYADVEVWPQDGDVL